jgi:hypothetical protein
MVIPKLRMRPMTTPVICFRFVGAWKNDRLTLGSLDLGTSATPDRFRFLFVEPRQFRPGLLVDTQRLRPALRAAYPAGSFAE